MSKDSSFYLRQATDSANAALGLVTVATIAVVLAGSVLGALAVNGQNVIALSVLCAVPIIILYSLAANFQRDAEENKDNYEEAIVFEGDVEDAIDHIINSRSVPPVTEI